MTVQITVRLPDDLVAFVDAEVADGTWVSRADAVAKALVRERRRRVALADVAILCRGADDDDLDQLAAWAADRTVDLDD